MKYTIIEDCSPYYIRFTHNGLDNIVNYCKSVIPNIENTEKTFIHHKLNPEQSSHVLSLIPIARVMEFKLDRVSLFITKPGRYYRAHKDGVAHRFSINYTVQILDNQCVTNWYSDNDLKDYQIVGLDGENQSRECLGFIKKNHKPLKSMVAKPNECILFNTELFHDFDNSSSTSTRVVLTLRLTEPLLSKIYFEDAKNILFGIWNLI